jgi:tRNA(fMet)-specific endonuclease VapC
MIYVWDTDTCIYWLKGREEIRCKVREMEEANIGVTLITLAELKYGAYSSQRVQQNLKNIENLLQEVQVLHLDQDSADRFGNIKARLRKKGKLIEDFDILIASMTLVNNGILVTSNTEHFKRIEGLKLENWLEQEQG